MLRAERMQKDRLSRIRTARRRMRDGFCGGASESGSDATRVQPKRIAAGNRQRTLLAKKGGGEQADDRDLTLMSAVIDQRVEDE